ncbi:Peptide-N(4)-(N-acetyl-beta-glucosaminyl)asparagine amidase [Bertholletia excelsa]
MACSLKTGLSVSGSDDIILGSQTKRVLRLRPSRASLRFTQKYSKDFMSKPVRLTDRSAKRCTKFSITAQPSICVSRVLRWWEKTPKPNMIDINSAQELVDFLSNAGDRLVVVDFYSPGCGGCRTLHPKICQLAELNPDAVFLKVNREELKEMCNCLHVHVLPFFRFYRGSEGKLCSFSCTIATIKKFKDALAKYGTERCNPGPAKGLDESELLRLASAGEISIKSSLSSTKEDEMEDLVLKDWYLPGLYAKTGNNKVEIEEEKGAALLV